MPAPQAQVAPIQMAPTQAVPSKTTVTCSVDSTMPGFVKCETLGGMVNGKKMTIENMACIVSPNQRQVNCSTPDGKSVFVEKFPVMGDGFLRCKRVGDDAACAFSKEPGPLLSSPAKKRRA